MGLIREERDPAFWEHVAAHPDVAPHFGLGGPVDLAALVANPLVKPLAAEHGGFLLFQMDGYARVFELHTLFMPDGWGREAAAAAKAMFAQMFAGSAQLIVTHEVEGNWRSRPPKTFRFAECGDFTKSPAGPRLKTWALSKTAWDVSPARQRMDA